MAINFPRITQGRIKLAASLGFNFLAKLPGILSVFVILPLISRSLGSSTYGEFLSALALGSACTLPFSGIGTVGRRLLATAHGASDRAGEADAFVSTFLSSGVISLIMSVVAYMLTGNPIFGLVSLLLIVTAFFNMGDNMRASYNEHYITAIFQFVFQLGIYGAVFIIGVPKDGILFSGLTLQSPYILASVATLILLLMQRPYLMRGKAKNLRRMMVPALGVIAADGALTALLNLSVFWLGHAGDTEYAAWFGTFARLFQSFSAPVMMILLPLTSYIAIHWQNLSTERRLRLHKLFMIGGIGYGALVGFLMAVGGSYYIKHMFTIAVEGDSFDIAAITLFIVAVIALKSYSLLLYAISEARRVSFATAGVAVFGIVIAGISGFWLPAHKVVDVLFLTTGTLLPILLFAESFFQCNTSRVLTPLDD